MGVVGSETAPDRKEPLSFDNHHKNINLAPISGPSTTFIFCRRLLATATGTGTSVSIEARCDGSTKVKAYALGEEAQLL